MEGTPFPRARPIPLPLWLLPFVALSLPFTSPGADVEAVPLAEVHPGMRGVAWTVFEGVEPDSFSVEVLGTLSGSEAGGSAIIVRGLGPRVSASGIAAGMSGSPVFVGERLLGAIAFTFVNAKEPLAGVTPFAEMRAAIDPALGRAMRDGPISPRASGASSGDLPDFAQWRREWTASLGAAALTPPGAPGPNGMLRLPLPVVTRGADGSALAGLGALFESLGWQAWPSGAGAGGAPGGVASGAAEDAAPEGLRPGAAVAVNLVSGDMDVSAVGTATLAEGDRVLAFGHPFLQGGSLVLPVSRALIHTIVPSSVVSFKIGSALEPLGAMLVDQRPGVGMQLGAHAPTIGLAVSVTQPDGSAEAFHFEVARHELIAPPMLALAAASAATARGFGLRLATLASRLEITLDDGTVIARDDLFRSLSAAQTVAGEVMAPLGYLAASPFEVFPVKAVSLDLRLSDELRMAHVVGLEMERAVVRPGDSLAVRVRLRHLQGGEELRALKLHIPPWVRGDQLLVMAGSVQAFTDWDQERAPEKYVARSQADLVRLLQEFPSDESLIVRLYGPSRGVVLRGRELASLPLSKWRALAGSAVGGETSMVAGAILDERMLRTGSVVLGGAMVEVEVSRSEER